MSITISGIVPVRNAFNLEYTLAETVESLLPVCDEVVISDGESTDGTQEFIRDWMTREPKIKLCVYDWPNPQGDVDFYVTWLQSLRCHASCTFVLQLDADEILSEHSYPTIERFKAETNPDDRVSLWCRRYNFWKDAQHLIPHGVCLGHRVVRIGPQSVWMPSDGPHPKGSEMIAMAVDSNVEIFHYGFLRRREAFFLKARELQKMFFNSYDPRLAAVERKLILEGEKAGENWMVEIENVEWINRLIPFSQTHPLVARSWLVARGYKLNGDDL